MILRGVALSGLSIPNAIKRLDGTSITSGTWTIYLTKDGGAQTTIAGSATHEGNGQWTFDLTASETDAAVITLRFVHTDAAPAELVLVTAPFVSGTAQAGASTTITLASGASATNSLYVGQVVTIVGGTGAGQARLITGYVGSTKVATVDSAWTTNPASGSAYLIAGGPALLAATLHAGATVPAVSTVTNLTNAPTSGDLTATMKASVGTAVAASAVASVTGNVGGNVAGSVGSVTGNVGGNVAGSVGSVAAGGITSGSFAAGAITSAVLATDCIGVDQLAIDAIEEIQSGLSTLTAAGVRSAIGLANADLDTQLGALATAASIATLSGSVGSILGTTNQLATAVESDGGGGYRFTADALALAPTDGGDPWSTAVPGSYTTGQAGYVLANLPTAAAVAAATRGVQLAESYPAVGVAPTLEQALLMMLQRLTEFVISGDQIIVKRLNQSGTAFVLGMDDADNPTSSSRSS